MPCRVCDHTLHVVTKEPPHTWWCPRCGSLHNGHGAESPLLVMRRQHLYHGVCEQDQQHMRSLGIVETVWPPSDRPGEMETAKSDMAVDERSFKWGKDLAAPSSDC